MNKVLIIFLLGLFILVLCIFYSKNLKKEGFEGTGQYSKYEIENNYPFIGQEYIYEAGANSVNECMDRCNERGECTGGTFSNFEDYNESSNSGVCRLQSGPGNFELDPGYGADGAKGIYGFKINSVEPISNDKIINAFEKSLKAQTFNYLKKQAIYCQI